MTDTLEYLKTEAARNQRLADRCNTDRRKRTHKYRAVHLQRAIAELEQARKMLAEIEIVAYGDQEDVTSESLLAWLRQTIAPRRVTTKDSRPMAKLCRCAGGCEGHFNCRIVWNDEALAREGLRRESDKITDEDPGRQVRPHRSGGMARPEEPYRSVLESVAKDCPSAWHWSLREGECPMCNNVWKHEAQN